MIIPLMWRSTPVPSAKQRERLAVVCLLQEKLKKIAGSTEIRTRIVGFRVPSANRYTMEPINILNIIISLWKNVRACWHRWHQTIFKDGAVNSCDFSFIVHEHPLYKYHYAERSYCGRTRWKLALALPTVPTLAFMHWGWDDVSGAFAGSPLAKRLCWYSSTVWSWVMNIFSQSNFHYKKVCFDVCRSRVDHHVFRSRLLGKRCQCLVMQFVTGSVSSEARVCTATLSSNIQVPAGRHNFRQLKDEFVELARVSVQGGKNPHD